MLMPPVLSELDPLQKGEGSIDPLGLAATYERLANQMLENVTVRMSRIRFVTALAVGTAVCEAWEEDERASDGVSSPWQVFEWAVVMAFVKAREDKSSPLIPVAGNQKVQRALDSGFAISSRTYLKTPTVFGFGGIFRRFAVGTGVIGRDMRLEEAGHALVRAWAEDNGLVGFRGSGQQGDGRRLLERLRKVVQRGLDQGSLKAADLPLDLAKELARLLDPSLVPPGRERDALRSLVESNSGLKEGAEFLARELRRHGRRLEPVEEAEFVRGLISKAPATLRKTLEEIDGYEALCRPLTDTFDWIRHWSSLRRGSPFTRSDFESEARSGQLLERVRTGLRRIGEVDRMLVADPAARMLVNRFEGVRSTADLFDAVLEFHQLIQAEKPPGGKRPWVEAPAGGKGIVVRAAYVLDDPPASDFHYVHEYRLPTLSRFLADLGAFS